MDVRVMVTDAKSYRSSTFAKKLEKMECEKKTPHEKVCLEQRRSFMALVYSVDGMSGKGGGAYKKRIANLCG